MKLNQNLLFTSLTVAALAAGAWAQTEVASNDAPAKGPAVAAPATAPAPVTAADIQELKDALAAQQKQIQALQAQLQAKEQRQQEQEQPQQQQVRSSALSAAPRAAAWGPGAEV